MEVHHHPEVEKKGFKEYILEGLMIFLAVMMGFFAESLREHIADHEKELQYVRSMIADAATDTVNLNFAIKVDEKRTLTLDSMANKCFETSLPAADDSIIYKLYRKSVSYIQKVTLTDRTIAQLNAGGMRLISNKTAIDSIVVYNAHGKTLINQQEAFDRFKERFFDAGLTVLNWKYVPISRDRKHASYLGAQLLIPDKIKVVQLGNAAKLNEGVLLLYVIRMQEEKIHAVNLINTLKKQYKLEDE